VYAIGNPLGAEFRGSVTKGIVSGTNRTILFREEDEEVFMEDLIQTDASINPGNSGGPLLNSQGEMVGINTVKLTTAEGIGFAMPINVVKPVIQRLEEEGAFEEASLGLYAYDNHVMPYLKGQEDFEGIYIVSIDPKGASSSTTLRKGDVITAIDGVKVDKMIKLREYLYTKKPGDQVTLRVQNGKEKQVTVTLKRK